MSFSEWVMRFLGLWLFWSLLLGGKPWVFPDPEKVLYPDVEEFFLTGESW